jgi:hypothetical protein
LNDALHTARDRYDAIRHELESNQRLRVLLYAVAVVFVFYGVLVASDYRDASARAYSAAQSQVARFEAFSRERDDSRYQRRLEEEERVAQRLSTWFWQAGTTGLAEADFQAWLQKQATDAGLENTRLRLSELVREDRLTEPVWKLEAEVSARADSAAVVAMLAALAQSEQRVIIDQLRYAKGRSRDRNRVSLMLIAYFQINESPEAQS